MKLKIKINEYIKNKQMIRCYIKRCYNFFLELQIYYKFKIFFFIINKLTAFTRN